MPRRPRRPIDRTLLLVSLGFALGLVLIGWGLLTAVTGDDAIGLPDQIESISPAPNDRQVLSQTEVFVDLVANTEAVLVIDGVEVETTRLGEQAVEPGQQIDLPPTAIYDPGNFSIRFRPTDGAVIERWETGVHVVTVIFWDVEEGRTAAKSFTWQFEVL